jgi:hypothetical protein
MKNISVLFLIIIAVLTGCNESPSSFTYSRQIVVTGMIEAGRTVDTVKVVYTGEVDKVYNRTDYAIPNAIVKVIGVDVSFEDSLIYDALNPGRYHSVNPLKIILPTKTYRLEIHTVDGKSVSAVTTVPDTFSMIYSTITNNSTVKYNTGEPVNFFSWSPSRLHGSYLPTVASLDTSAPRIPKSFIKDTTQGPPPQKVGYRVGLPKEQNYTELPWIFLSYYGKTRFDIFAIDDNYNHFLNQYYGSQGGELAEINYNIQGGIGIFWARTQAKGGITANIIP